MRARRLRDLILSRMSKCHTVCLSRLELESYDRLPERKSSFSARFSALAAPVRYRWRIYVSRTAAASVESRSEPCIIEIVPAVETGHVSRKPVSEARGDKVPSLFYSLTLMEAVNSYTLRGRIKSLKRTFSESARCSCS